MGCQTVNSWTLAGLLMAFMDLTVAYFLLCVSVFAFFPSKTLSFLGLCLPCPCSGLFGYQNSNLCLQKLLFDWPIRKIYSVQELVKNRFPFDLVSFKDHHSLNSLEGVGDRKYENGLVELDGEAACSSISGPMLQSSVDKERGFNPRGRKTMNQKQKSGFRPRRRRVSLGYGIVSSALSDKSVSLPALYGSEMRSEPSESLETVSGVEDGFFDDGNGHNGFDLDERFGRNFEFSGSDDKGKGISDDLSSVHNGEDKACSFADDTDAIRTLEQALEEEKATHTALYQELEKERAAAASAADEALAMILRLQEDKASIEMEARQYQRMIDEKFVYDEEEMNILKEIIVRRETEIHFLEKEVEAYREKDFSGNEQLEGNLSYKTNSSGKSPALSIDLDVNPLLIGHQIEKCESIDEKGTTNCASSDYEQDQTPFVNEKISKEIELALDSSASQKTTNLGENDTASRDIGTMCGGIGEESKKDGKCFDHGGCNRYQSVLETEPTVCDVHVIDDKTIIWKDDDGKEYEPLTITTSNSEVWRGILPNGCPSTSVAETQCYARESSLDTSSRCKTSSVDLQRNTSCAVDTERLKIDAEVEWLREKLRMVQEEKEKLSFSAEHRERARMQLKLVEEIMNQLREIQQLREPPRHAPLPPSSLKQEKKEDNI